MRLYFTILFFTLIKVQAQMPELSCKQVKDIAMMERMAHQRLGGNGTGGAETITSASNNFDVKYYRCEWEVDPAIRYIKGKVTVYYVITSSTTFIALDMLSPLSADSVTQRSAILAKQFSNNTLSINFPTTVNAGTLDSVSIFYQGVPAATGFGSFIQDMHAGVPVIWTLSEPYGARDWWPCKNGLDDKADSIDVFVTHPVAYKAASNGLFQSETLIAGGTKKITHWKHRYPIATYLMCMAVTNYAVFNNTVQLGAVILPMQTYCYPEDLTAFQTQTQFTLDAMKLYNGLFGEYPFIKEKYGHVQFGWGGGMEHQTSTFVVSADENLCAHELGHQWFGDKITTGSWKDTWLNEGFATQLATLFRENKYPQLTVSERKIEINFITSLPGGSVLVDDTTDVNRIFDARLTYYKGSHLLHMLRWKLGDSVFFQALRNYQKDPKLMYGFTSTADLKRNLEATSGQNLTKFFDQWYAGQGYPTYKVEWSTIGSAYVRIRMSQTTSHPSVSFFEMPVALQFKNGSQQKTMIVDNKTNDEIFIRNIGFVPDTVIIDPENWIISRDNTSAKVTDVVSGQHIVQVYPNPVTDPLLVYLRNFPESSAVLNLYNAAGQLIYTQNVSINGSQFIEIPSKKLSAGIYSLQIKAGNSFRFVKKILKL
ncbi:MAG: M1 family aminopeptidase [Ferruginibacter sp.]